MWELYRSTLKWSENVRCPTVISCSGPGHKEFSLMNEIKVVYLTSLFLMVCMRVRHSLLCYVIVVTWVRGICLICMPEGRRAEGIHIR